MADTGLGRRNILIATLFTDSILTISSSLIARSLNTLVIFRLLNGFVIGAPATLIFSYLGEFHTQLTRHKCLCYTGMFYTLSWVLLPGKDICIFFFVFIEFSYLKVVMLKYSQKIWFYMHNRVDDLVMK